MLNLYELSQFAAFAELGTLSRVAEAFHVSTPSVTRAMQHIEEQFGAALFTRGKNKIALNQTGVFAAESARKLLLQADETVRQVQDFDLRQRTIVVRSCAPAPLWKLLPQLSASHSGMTISSAICRSEEVLAAWEDGACDIAILPFPFAGGEEWMREQLFVCVPKHHELAAHETLTFADINGFNFLLRTELGFWDVLCREKMPASKFLVQTDGATFTELVNASSLPCFTTDYFHQNGTGYSGRVNIPLTDSDANVTFYIAKKM